MNDDLPMQFGKHRGERLADIPVEYLDWLIGCDWCRDPLKAQVTAHLRTRPEWARLGDDEPAMSSPEVTCCGKCAEDLTPSGWCNNCQTYPYGKVQ